MKRILLLSVWLIFSLIISFGQPIAVTPTSSTLTVNNLVHDTLVSGCVEAFNIVYIGNSGGIGYFNATGTSFDTIMTSGIVMASGAITNAIGPNNEGGVTTNFGAPGDADLNSLIPQQTHDASVLEFDFIPASDSLEFKYVFGSDEYLEYVNSSYNDIFAFFLSGPNPSGGSYYLQNIALVPGTVTPVSINNVNTGSYPQYYIVNGTGANPNNEALEYDGYTVGLYARASVIPCETYHIKLAVADAGDSVLDSGVFIEAGSFTDGSAVTISNVNPTGTYNDLYEGCTSYYVFTRLDTTDLSDTVYIPLAFGGTATNGADLTQFPSTIVILPGNLADTVQYTVFNDNIIEPTETFIISILSGCPCNPEPASDTITLYDFTEFKASIVNTDSMFCGTSAPVNYTISATCVTHPAWFTNFTWSTGATDTAIVVPTPPPGHHSVYWVEIADICGNSIIDSLTIGVSNLSGLNVTDVDAQCYNYCNGTVNAVATQIGPTPGKFFKWSDLPNVTTTGVRNNLCFGFYSVTVTDSSYCAYSAPFFIDQPNAALDPSSGILPFDSTYCNDPGQITLTASANISNVHYAWNGGIQGSQPTTNVFPVNGVNTYWVAISDYCGYTVRDTVRIFVSNIENSSLVGNDATCNQVCDGNIEVLTPLGIPPFLYQWTSQNSGSFSTTQNTLTQLCPDSFNLVVTDYAGCNFYADMVINEPPAFSYEEAYISTSDTMWCGVTPPASIQLNASSNLEDVAYMWSNGQTGSYINVTPVQGDQIYWVNISDFCGNSKTDSIHIIVSNLSGINVTTSPTTCYNSCDGSVNIVPTGGLAPLTYLWTPTGIGEPNSGMINDLCAGNYSVLVRDAGGCEFVANFTISSPPDLNECKITNTNTMFCGVSAPSSITINTLVNNNVTYYWSTGETTSSISFTPVTGPNIYWVDFTDACNNVFRDSVVFSISNFSGANLIVTPATCFGECDGSVLISPIFGITPYSFEWSMQGIPNTSNMVQNACAGSYTVTISDFAQCFVVKNFNINQPDSIRFNFFVQHSMGTQCNGFATVIDLQGGTSPYTYLWNDPLNQTTYNAGNLCPGIYTVTITDSKGCTNADTIRIRDLVNVDELVISQQVDVYPNPSSNGEFNVNLNGCLNAVDMIQIYDVTGRVVQMIGQEIIQEKFVIRNIPAGINLLQITLKDDRSIQKKLIVTD
jgi:hypothetical protein